MRVDGGSNEGARGGFGGAPCDNLVTIGGAAGRAGRFRGFLARFVSGVVPRCVSFAPLRASKIGTQDGGMGDKRDSGGAGVRWSAWGFPHLPMDKAKIKRKYYFGHGQIAGESERHVGRALRASPAYA